MNEVADRIKRFESAEVRVLPQAFHGAIPTRRFTGDPPCIAVPSSPWPSVAYEGISWPRGVEFR